jgi:ADP-heptose:LPS heptosyltransferase
VAVFRALALGDLLCAVPALRALRAALPDAEITLIGLSWAESFARRFSRYLDGFIAFPGYPGLPESPARIKAIPAFLADVQARRFDLALQLHGSGGITNPLVSLFGARQSAGYVVPGEYCPDPERFLPYPADEPEVRVHLRLMAFLGVPLQGEALEFPLSEADDAALGALPEVRDLRAGEYICVHPGARLRSRRWPPERFAAVADALAGCGVRVVLTGSAGEADLTRAVAAAMRAPALDLAGRTDLGALAALVRDARLLISNDTGLSHVAAALRVPSVVIASGSDVRRWAPLDRVRHRLLWHDVACRPCAHEECPIGHPCALGVPVSAVVAEAERLLAGGPAAPVLAADSRSS